MPGLPVLYRLPLADKVTPQQIRHAITIWMKENHDRIGFVRDISETVTGWGLKHIQRSFCSSFCSNLNKHFIEPAGVIPGFEVSKGSYVDLVVYLHRQPESKGWEACFAWDSKQKPSGYRSQDIDQDPRIVLEAFASMPKALWLPAH